MPRLFAALTLPASVREEIASLASPLSGATWTPTENLHLTLRFIGETDPARQEQFETALARVRVEPFIVPVEGLGVFPTRGPAKVLWVGLGTAHPRLFQLRKQVDEALLSVEPGLDVSSFHPHITLARLGRDYDTKELTKYLERHLAFEAPPFRVNAFQLMASEPGRDGAGRVYRPAREYSLS